MRGYSPYDCLTGTCAESENTHVLVASHLIIFVMYDRNVLYFCSCKLTLLFNSDMDYNSVPKPLSRLTSLTHSTSITPGSKLRTLPFVMY